MCRQRTGWRLVTALAGLLALASGAAAGTISHVIFHLDAANGQGTGSLEAYDEDLVYSSTANTWVWNKGQTPILNGSGQQMATLTSAKLTITRDPALNAPYRLDLNYALLAGSSLTRFTITTALLSFPAIPPEYLVGPTSGGRATISSRVDDKNHDGAQLLAYGPIGAGMFTPQYNGLAPGGTTFANLLNQVQAGVDGYGTGGEDQPASGYLTIPATVSDMSGRLDFTLTAADTVNGSTTYRILPEPSAGLGLLLLAALAAARRR